MVDPTDPKKPRPPRRRATPKAAGAPAPRKRPALKAEAAPEEPVATPAPDEIEDASQEASEPVVKPKAPPKPRSTKRTAPRKVPPRKPAAIKPAPAPALGKQGLDRVGGKWGVASILGSLAAAAGLTAALLSLKRSTPERDGDKGEAKDRKKD